jgi:hypothetical protein
MLLPKARVQKVAPIDPTPVSRSVASRLPDLSWKAASPRLAQVIEGGLEHRCSECRFDVEGRIASVAEAVPVVRRNDCGLADLRKCATCDGRRALRRYHRFAVATGEVRSPSDIHRLPVSPSGFT